jgi:hypothetical protein
VCIRYEQKPSPYNLHTKTKNWEVGCGWEGVEEVMVKRPPGSSVPHMVQQATGRMAL